MKIITTLNSEMSVLFEQVTPWEETKQVKLKKPMHIGRH